MENCLQTDLGINVVHTINGRNGLTKRIAFRTGSTGRKYPRGIGWGKPKGMHWRTYERLSAEHDRFAGIVDIGFRARFGTTGD